MTKKHARQYFICSPNFKSHNFWNRESLHACCLHLQRKHHSTFLVCPQHLMLGTLWLQSPAHVKQWVLREAKFFCTRPSSWLYVRNRHKRELFFGTKKLTTLQIFKPLFKQLGFYKSHQSLLSRNSFLVLDSGITPKWVLPSSLLTGWRMLSARKGSRATGRPSRTYLSWTSSHPRKIIMFWRSSFLMIPTSTSTFTPMGTLRNTLCTLLQPSASSSRRGWTQGVGILRRLF